MTACRSASTSWRHSRRHYGSNYRLPPALPGRMSARKRSGALCLQGRHRGAGTDARAHPGADAGTGYRYGLAASHARGSHLQSDLSRDHPSVITISRRNTATLHCNAFGRSLVCVHGSRVMGLPVTSGSTDGGTDDGRAVYSSECDYEGRSQLRQDG